jgi:hypothetical protein
VAKITFAEIDEAAVRTRRAPLSATVKQLQARFTNVISYESRGSADLEVDASRLGRSFNDANIAALSPLRANILWADFSGTSISDASAAALAGMEHLRVLRLMDANVTDMTILTLASLKELKALTVVGTAATAKSLLPLKNKGIRIYDESDAEQSSDAKH